MKTRKVIFARLFRNDIVQASSNTTSYYIEVKHAQTIVQTSTSLSVLDH